MQLGVVDRHQLRIARQTMGLSTAGALILGGMDHAQALEVIARLAPRELAKYQAEHSAYLAEQAATK